MASQCCDFSSPEVVDVYGLVFGACGDELVLDEENAEDGVLMVSYHSFCFL